jgi:arylsulfatase A-like enzyme
LRPSKALAGAAWGIVFWSAYAIVEYFLYSAVPLFQESFGIFTLSHWSLSGVLFDCYWILGALAGAAFGAILARWDLRTQPGDAEAFESGRLPAALSLIAAVLINLCSALPLRHFALMVAIIAASVGAAILWVLRHPRSFLGSWIDFHPLLLAFLLISPVWLSTEGIDSSSPGVKFAAAVLCAGAALGLTRLLHAAPRWPSSVHFFSGLATLAVLVLACGFQSGGRKVPLSVALPSLPNPGRSPVVLVSLDTTRADHTSIEGYLRNTTPHLAEFAASATFYPHAMAAFDMTLAAHASMFTGVYPSWHGARIVDEEPQPLDGKLPTLAGILRDKGYFTAGAVANSAYLTPRWGLTRGFGSYDVQAPVELLSAERRFELRQGLRALLNLRQPTAEFDLVFRRGEEINDTVFRIMEQPGVRQRAFFLFVNYMDSHAPYSPPAPFDTAFLGGQPGVTFARYRLVHRRRERLSPDEYRRLAAQYDGGIAYEDYAFSQLIQWLKARGLYDRALIIVAGDHGESFGERGLLGHGSSVHGDQINIPLVVKFPYQVRGAVVEAPVSQVDLLPTVLDTLGYEIPAHVQGLSLRNTAPLAHREILAESDHARALRVDGMKLIVSSTGRRELYDLSCDPEENRDLYASRPPQAQPLEAALNRWVQRLPRPRTAATDPGELRRLKTLGYVQ